MPVNMKRMISKELFSLIEEKGIDKINVQLLASRCGISRQAFYYHFKDIADVFDWTCQELLNNLKKKKDRQTDLSDVLQLYLDMAVTCRHHLMRICASSHYYSFEKLLCHYTRLFLEDILLNQWSDTTTAPENSDFFLDLFSPALFFHALHLSQQTHPDTKRDAQQLAHLFRSQISC